ncbi:MAG: ferric reductase-like transmembrane domain-containing protein [Acidimicrobiales bacterium]
MTATLAVVVHNGTALWYLTRATGLVSLVLLSATVVLGLVASVGWTAARWPRFLSQAVHRNLSLFCIVLIALHILTTVADGFVPIGYLDAFVPLLSPYRPLWIGLGALAFDLLLAVAITSGLRGRIGVRTWRGVHYLAYACWPIAVLHGLGSGTDARLSITVLINVVCIGSVVGALAWRLMAARGVPSARRLAAAGVATVLVIGIGAFAIAGPLQPGWSKRAGTSAAVLAEINAHFAVKSASVPSGSAAGPATSKGVASSPAGTPAVPFTANVTGTIQSSSPNAAGEVEVVLAMQVQGSGAPLVVKLMGTAVNGGVAMSSSQVVFGDAQGAVTALDGSNVAATVRGPSGPINLQMLLNIDQSAGSVSGTVSGSSGGR